MLKQPRSELGSISREILEDLERVRKGWDPKMTEPEMLKLAKDRAHLRLEEILEQQNQDGILESPNQLHIFQREIDAILVPRYSLLAMKQNLAEFSSQNSLRGATLYNRLFYATLFFIIGIFIIWAPFIPLWDKWIPFVCAAIAPLVSPWLPNIHQFLLTRRHQIALLELHYDIDQAGLSLQSLDSIPSLPGSSQSS